MWNFKNACQTIKNSSGFDENSTIQEQCFYMCKFVPKPPLFLMVIGICNTVRVGTRRANLTRITSLSNRTPRRFPSYLLSTLFLYFLFIFYLPWCTLPLFPSISSQTFLTFLSCCHWTSKTRSILYKEKCWKYLFNKANLKLYIMNLILRSNKKVLMSL